MRLLTCRMCGRKGPRRDFLMPRLLQYVCKDVAACIDRRAAREYTP